MSIEERLLRRLDRKIENIIKAVDELKKHVDDIEKKNYWSDWISTRSPLEITYGQSTQPHASICLHAWGAKSYDAFGNGFQSCIRCGANQIV